MRSFIQNPQCVTILSFIPSVPPAIKIWQCNLSSGRRKSVSKPPPRGVSRDMQSSVFSRASDVTAAQKMPLEYIRSSKGADLLVVNGCTFRQEKVIRGKRIWKCTEYSTIRCNSRCHTLDDEIFKGPTEHNHIPDVARLEARRIVGEMKERAASSQAGTHEIVTSTAQMAPLDVHLPSVDNLKQVVRRVRQKIHSPLAITNSFTTLEDLSFGDEYRCTSKGEPFLLYDSGPGPSRFVTFTTEANLRLLSTFERLYADGTFKSCPPLFQQLYTIHAVANDTVIPLVFILMSHKTTSHYLLVLTELRDLCPRLQPTCITAPFDNTSLAALREVFPDCSLRGCFFHFSRCVWLKMQQMPSISKHYLNNQEYALNIHCLLALAFVPSEDVAKGFEELVDTQFFVDNMEELIGLVEYFEETWVGRPGRKGLRSKPVFDVELWNCYGSALDDLLKISHSVEDWHKDFNHLLGKCGVNLWGFINCFKKEQSLTEGKVEKFLAGQERRSFKAVELKLKIAAYRRTPLLKYLRSTALHLRFNF